MSDKICQHCGAKIPEDSQFCPTCGQKFALRQCPSCGNPIPDDSDFCPVCGKKIAAGVCEACGKPVSSGGKFCPVCENQLSEKKARKDSLLARQKAEEHARQEAEGAREKAKIQAEAEKEKARREQEAAKEARQAALSASRKAEAAAREKVRQEKETARTQAVIPAPHKRKGIFIAGGAIGILVIAVIIFVLAFGRMDSQPQKPTTVANITTTPSPTFPVTSTVDSNTPKTGTLTDTASPTPAKTTVPPTTSSSPSISPTTAAPTLAEVLARTSAIKSVKYENMVTRPGTPSTSMKIWEKGNLIRLETMDNGVSAVILINNDAQTVYRYVPSQNTAEKMPYPSPAKTAMQAAKALSGLNPVVAGTASLNKEDCLIVTYSISGTPLKMWLWQKYGFPLRLEETSSAGTTVVEYSNVDFSEIADSQFQLPSGVKITGSGPNPPSP